MDLFLPKIWAPKPAAQDSSSEGDDNKTPTNVQSRSLDSDTSDEESFTSNAQDGVKAIEAITSVWSRSHLIMAYVLSALPTA